MKYSIYAKDGTYLYVTENREFAEAEVLAINGYATDGNGVVVIGKKPVSTIDLTPTWEALLPLFVTAIEHGTPTGRALAIEELTRLAKFADEMNKK